MTDPNDPINALVTNERDLRGATLPGLTKREYFAALILAGRTANTDKWDEQKSAKLAVQLADELIEELNK